MIKGDKMKLNKEEMDIISNNASKGYTVEFESCDYIFYEAIKIFDENGVEIYFRNSDDDVWRINK